MIGRVSRKNNRRRNVASLCVHEWLILGDRAVGECHAPTHAKEFARLQAEFQLFGPWGDVRELPVCGCRFVTLPVCAL